MGSAKAWEGIVCIGKKFKYDISFSGEPRTLGPEWEITVIFTDSYYEDTDVITFNAVCADLNQMGYWVWDKVEADFFVWDDDANYGEKGDGLW